MSKEYLDRKEVERIINRLKEVDKMDGGDKIHACNFEELITQICQLKPKNQVVIAEGKIKKIFGWLPKKELRIWFSEIEKVSVGIINKGKKVKIILEEVK